VRERRERESKRGEREERERGEKRGRGMERKLKERPWRVRDDRLWIIYNLLKAFRFSGMYSSFALRLGGWEMASVCG
jgi:hypothetical protein